MSTGESGAGADVSRRRMAWLSRLGEDWCTGARVGRRG